MNAEEFEAWKTSQATQWVLRKVAEKAAELEQRTRDQLYHATGQTPEEWAVLQARAGCDRGTVIGMNFVVGLELEEIDEPNSNS